MADIHLLAMRANRSGGADVYTADLVRHLASRGHRVTLVCYAADPDLARICRLVTLPRPDFGARRFVWRASAWLQLLACARALRAAPLDAPEIVIGSAQQIIWAHARRFPRAPLVYVPHSLIAPREVATYPCGSSFQRFAAVRLFEWLEKWALHRAVATVRFNQTSCDALAQYYGPSAGSRLAVFPMPVTIPAEPLRPRTVQRPPTLLYVGRLVPTKNVAFLIAALSRLHHLAWSLDLVGDGEERPRLERQVREAGLQPRVVFHGHQDAVGPWYRRADLLVFPSRLESMGLVLLEAMSYGVPTLSIRADGARYHNATHEILTDGAEGWLAANERDFVERLENTLQSPDELPECGRRARQAVKRRHGWSDHLARYERLFRTIVSDAA